jgi:RNA-binding protein
VNVPAPSNPKKQSLMPASRLRKDLRAAGHHLSPVVQVGKEGLTPAVTAALDEQLLAHELIKVKVGTESPEDRFEVAASLAGLPGTFVAQVLGRTVLLYRKHPEKPRYEAADPALVKALAKAKARAEADRLPAKPRRRAPPRATERRPAPRATEGRPASRRTEGRPPPRRTEGRPPPRRTEGRPPPRRTERRPPRGR